MAAVGAEVATATQAAHVPAVTWARVPPVRSPSGGRRSEGCTERGVVHVGGHVDRRACQRWYQVMIWSSRKAVRAGMAGEFRA